MPTNLTHTYFCVAGNNRLAFQGSSSSVESYIASRMRHNGVSYQFFEGWAALEERVSELVNDPPSGIEFIAIIDSMNPFTDFSLAERMAQYLSHTQKAFCISEGAVPGTEVSAMLTINGIYEKKFSMSDVNSGDGGLVRWETQAQYNNQLNLYKYKRLKMFLALIKKFEDLPSLSIPSLFKRLSSDEAFDVLSAFGDHLKQISYKYCPHCQGSLTPLVNTMSQPFCGYLPADRPMYHECEYCGLVVQSPSIDPNEVSSIYDEWDKEDFVVSANNPYTVNSIRCDFSRILPKLPNNTRSLDLGGGVGNFSKYLYKTYPSWDVTHSDFAIKSSASDGVRSRTLDFTSSAIGSEQYELITAWEVIEHITYDKLEYVLQNIYDALVPGGFFVFSTPDFDSPACKSFDFYALCPPFHYLVFSERWLRRYFADSKQFDVFDVKHCSDFLDDALNWYSYGAKTSPSMAIRSTAQLLHAIFEMDADYQIRKRLSAAGMGTEIIMTLKKRVKD
jgi:SAM-dependent methyltransferase